MPLLTPARALAVGTLLGPLEETKVNWYLEHPYVEVLLVQLSPHLDKIAQVVLHYAVSVCISLKFLYIYVASYLSSFRFCVWEIYHVDLCVSLKVFVICLVSFV